MSESLIEFDNVTKRFGDFTAVNDVSFSINRGEFVSIMGPSGCGKTTSLRMLAGLETPDEGEIRINGQRMNEVSANDRDTPLVWQSLALFPFLNVQQNVEFGLKMRGIEAAERRERASKWLERMEIAEFSGRDISQLSGGQRQRVALARALGNRAGNSTVGRTSIRTRCTSRYSYATGAHTVAKRAWHHLCLCDPFPIRSICDGR